MTKDFSVECKSKEKLPRWLEKCWEQAVNNKEGDKVALLQIHKTGNRHTEDFIVLRLEDFLNLLHKS